jgi:myo-inositol-1(or 4)-monophosphatase
MAFPPDSPSPSGPPIDLPSILADLISTAHLAGAVILSASLSSPTSLSTKLNSADLVTETDKAVETLISKTLLSKYPTFAFYGEETFTPGMKLTNHPTFIVDPIDGTTNFVHGYPYFCVSLGFAVNRFPTVGVIFNPVTGLLYTGIKDQGSFRIDTRLSPSDPLHRRRLPLRPAAPLGSLSNCIVAIEFGSDRSGANWECKLATWAKLGKSREEGGAMFHSARALGSAALNLCSVAEGGLDLYWEGGCWAWDVCAGWVILGEAGGMVVDGNPGTWEGRAVEVDERRYLAVRGGEGQREVVEEFWGCIVGEMDYVS